MKIRVLLHYITTTTTTTTSTTTSTTTESTSQHTAANDDGNDSKPQIAKEEIININQIPTSRERSLP
jgi:hypothetical protein